MFILSIYPIHKRSISISLGRLVAQVTNSAINKYHQRATKIKHLEFNSLKYTYTIL